MADIEQLANEFIEQVLICKTLRVTPKGATVDVHLPPAIQAARAALLAAIEKQEKDARRYRWLRAEDCPASVVMPFPDKTDSWCPAGAELDEAIDAASRRITGVR